MKLVALWTADFISGEPTTINLGDAFTFNFEYDANLKSLTIRSSQTRNYVNFFNEPPINQMSAIIGRNGSGKSTFLFLLRLVNENVHLNNPAVLIFSEGSEYFYYSHQLSLNSQILKISNSIENSVDIKEVKINPMNRIKLIYFSHFTETSHHFPDQARRTIDISVQSEIINSLRIEATNNKVLNHLGKTIIENKELDPLLLYRKKRFKQLLSYLLNERNTNNDLILNQIQLPHYINAKINHLMIGTVISNTPKNQSSQSKKDPYGTFIEHLDRIKNTITKSELFLEWISLGLTAQSINNSAFKQTVLAPFWLKILNDIELQNHVLIFPQLLKALNSNEYPESKKYYNQLIKLQETLLDIDSEITQNFPFEAVSGSFKIPLHEKSWRIISAIDNLVDLQSESFIEFSWHDLSSGEESILNQLAQIYHKTKKIKEEHVVLCLDEGEVFLHPEWQRKYVYNIYQFIRRHFNSSNAVNKLKSIQIIFTSHSAFVATEFPIFSLTMLNKKINNESNEIIPRIEQNSFGGNIFQLFKNNFFLEDLYGEFSKSKVREAIDYLKSKDSKIFNEQNIQSFTNLIGEPVIREVLNSELELNQKNDDFEYVDLEKKAQEILNKIKLKDDNK